MRKYIILLFLVLVSLSHAANITEWNTEISIENDRSTEWLVNYIYAENVTRSDYFILSKITGVEVKVGNDFIDCKVLDSGLGTSILCENINTSRISYRFRALGLVNPLKDLNKFNYRISVTDITDRFYIIIKLPLGAGLAENTKLQGTGLRQYEPEWGTGGSDGRRIFVQWKLDNPQLGRTLDISVIYENILSTANITSIAILAVIVIVFIAMILAFRKHEIRDLLPVLTESERKVVEILLKERKEVDQRKLVREIDYSKSKISRTLQNLQARGIVEIRRKGRTNIITLKTNKQKSPERVENK